jgi:hypothetical protein
VFVKLVHNSGTGPWQANTAIEEILVHLSRDPTSPVVVIGAYLTATPHGSLATELFTRAFVGSTFPAPRRAGDSDKYKTHCSLKKFHAMVTVEWLVVTI